MRHLIPILVLPFNVLITIPSIILLISGGIRVRWGIGWWQLCLSGLGVLFIIAGLTLIIRTVRLFHTVGKGTLAPWDPPSEFVATGVYLYTRNPMISGGVLALLGEVLVFGSVYLLAWLLIFFTAKTLYFILHEEPELEKRFGNSYRQYKSNVPRWFPRKSPWKREIL